MGLVGRIPTRLLAAGMAVALVACSRDSGPVSPTPTTRDTPAVPTWSLSGVVTERFQTVDLPVLGATVSIADGPDASRNTVTDDTGTYEFNGLEQGEFTVRATRNGSGHKDRIRVGFSGRRADCRPEAGL